MHVLVVTCELILAVKPVFAAIVAAEHVAWEFRNLGAVFSLIVSDQTTEFLGGTATTILGAFISSLMFEMGSLVAVERSGGVIFQMIWNFCCVSAEEGTLRYAATR